MAMYLLDIFSILWALVVQLSTTQVFILQACLCWVLSRVSAASCLLLLFSLICHFVAVVAAVVAALQCSDSSWIQNEILDFSLHGICRASAAGAEGKRRRSRGGSRSWGWETLPLAQEVNLAGLNTTTPKRRRRERCGRGRRRRRRATARRRLRSSLLKMFSGKCFKIH